jgi:hypothetical protein
VPGLEGVAGDRCAFWFGSVISFGPVDGLKKIVPRVIEFLRVQIVAEVPLVGSRKLRHFRARFMLAQNPDDLFLAESAALHSSVSFA